MITTIFIILVHNDWLYTLQDLNLILSTFLNIEVTNYFDPSIRATTSVSPKQNSSPLFCTHFYRGKREWKSAKRAQSQVCWCECIGAGADRWTDGGTQINYAGWFAKLKGLSAAAARKSLPIARAPRPNEFYCSWTVVAQSILCQLRWPASLPWRRFWLRFFLAKNVNFWWLLGAANQGRAPAFSRPNKLLSPCWVMMRVGDFLIIGCHKIERESQPA